MEMAIQLERKGKAEFYVVLVKIKYRDVWKFLRSFYTYARAENFVDELQQQIEKGDYSCLTLKM